jgi:hypothetical protein
MRDRIRERMTIELLERQFREVRRWTRTSTDRVPDDWFYRRVDWTDNTVGWHMGHLAWQIDIDTELCFDIDRALDPEWDQLFGYGSEPWDASAYPPIERVRRVFDTTLQRYLEQLGQIEEDSAILRTLPRAPEHTRLEWTILTSVVHLITHEGEHANGIGTLLRFFERQAQEQS